MFVCLVVWLFVADITHIPGHNAEMYVCMYVCMYITHNHVVSNKNYIFCLVVWLFGCLVADIAHIPGHNAEM